MLSAEMPMEGVMFRCGKTLIALALVMAIPVAATIKVATSPATSRSPSPEESSPSPEESSHDD